MPFIYLKIFSHFVLQFPDASVEIFFFASLFFLLTVYLTKCFEGTRSFFFLRNFFGAFRCLFLNCFCVFSVTRNTPSFVALRHRTLIAVVFICLLLLLASDVIRHGFFFLKPSFLKPVFLCHCCTDLLCYLVQLIYVMLSWPQMLWSYEIVFVSGDETVEKG